MGRVCSKNTRGHRFTRRIEMEFLVVGKDGKATVDVPRPEAKPQRT